MQLVEHIDRHVPKRGSGPSVGTYLLAAVLNRCLAPGSKASLARWFDSTALGRLLPLRSSQLTSQRFWDHMHRVPVSAIPAIERDIVTAMTREFGLDLRQVLFDAQCRTLLREIAKRRQHLRALQRQLRRWRDGKIRGGRKPGVATTRKKVDGWLRARHMRDLFDVQVREEDGLPKVNYRFQRRAWEQLQRRLLGKTLLFTDQAGWSDAELVRGYRAQHHVESAFRQLKDSDCIAIRPQYHWTDQKIAVHVFCCVLALMLCGLLQRELSRHGVSGSIPALLDALGGIREVDVLYPAQEEGGDPELRTTLSQMTDEQRRMYEIPDLESQAIQPLMRLRRSYGRADLCLCEKRTYLYLFVQRGKLGPGGHYRAAGSNFFNDRRLSDIFYRTMRSSFRNILPPVSIACSTMKALDERRDHWPKPGHAPSQNVKAPPMWTMKASSGRWPMPCVGAWTRRSTSTLSWV